jgi:hypothetical protein
MKKTSKQKGGRWFQSNLNSNHEEHEEKNKVQDS